MMHHLWLRNARRGPTAVRGVLPLLLFLAVSPARAQPWDAVPVPPQAPLLPRPSAASRTLSLAECLDRALKQHPRIAATRASLAAAEDASRALETLNIPVLLDRELPIRRKQAALGIAAAAAAVDRAEHEAVYAVTRTYFTVLYARQQERVARGVVDRLAATRDLAQKQVDAGSKEVTANDVRRTLVYLHLAETKRIQAEEGVQRALAALKEAIGLEPHAVLDVPAGSLPDKEIRLTKEDVIDWALTRRGELIEAGIFAEVACLEVEAQGTSKRLRMQTFAAGSDIHSHQVPQGVHNSEYRPAAVPPEMPTLLAGSRSERVQRAQSLSNRAQAIVEVARSLVTLEAEEAFLKWQEASRQVPKAREAATTGEQLAADLDKDFGGGAKVKTEDVVNAHVLASQARSQYNEFLYNQVLALAELERVTAGGFCAGLTPGPPLRTTPAKAPPKKPDDDPFKP